MFEGCIFSHNKHCSVLTHGSVPSPANYWSDHTYRYGCTNKHLFHSNLTFLLSLPLFFFIFFFFSFFYLASLNWRGKVHFQVLGAQGLTVGTSGKESACQCRRHKRLRFDPWVGKISWRRKWQPTPVFLPVKFHGQRSLVAYSPACCKELDTTEQLNTDLYRLFPTPLLLVKWMFWEGYPERGGHIKRVADGGCLRQLWESGRTGKTWVLLKLNCLGIYEGIWQVISMLHNPFPNFMTNVNGNPNKRREGMGEEFPSLTFLDLFKALLV